MSTSKGALNEQTGASARLTVDSILFADTAQLNGASRIGYAMFNDEISARAEMLRNEEMVVCAYEITSVVPSLSLDINIL
jgi:hypothetical protein